ncbi:DUF6257 family protein [Streptomyces sp. NPDC018019]|uniref:DUF6257 family protein n=1 Tax=Streptomyces sp. NPDC018019 TaxID=3365030 RepID=UPI0037B285FA
MSYKDPPLTAWEKTRLAWLGARMCKRELLAGEDVYQDDLQDEFDQILSDAWARAGR